jgi:hypothetical protein
MALPPSGPISMDNMNTDRSIASGTQIDLDTAAIAYSIPTKPHGMDEFYGLSIGPPTAPPTAPYHVWNLYRSAGDTHPACSTTPAAQVIPYDSNYAIGVVFKGSNGFCYTIANDGFQVSPANITLDTEYGLCTDCTETPPPPTAPPPPTPPVYYYNATRCGTSTNYIVYGGGNYYGTGTVVISGGTSYCYTIQNEVGATSYDDTVGASVDNCSNASCYVPPPPTAPPTPPTLTMSVSQGCVNYAGTGTISITGVSNGSGNYVYHIGGSIDFNDPNAYNLNSSASGLANGNYSVAVYDSSTGANVNETRNINCPAAPPPPPTAPPPVCYTFNIINYNANETVTGTYTNCSGFSDSFSFTDTSGTSTIIGTICVLDGTTPTITSGNGAASNSSSTC